MKKGPVIIILGLILTAVVVYVLQVPNGEVVLTLRDEELQSTETPPLSDANPFPVDSSSPAPNTQPTPEQPQQENTSAGEYLEYSETIIQQKLAEGKKVVLFFHAAWCPTCRSADNNIRQALHELPAGVALLKVDYDRERTLKNTYGVSYQHTFVQIAEDRSPITKFQGTRTVSAIVANLQ